MPSRLVAIFAGVTLAVLAAGAVWELVRYGASDDDTAARLEREVRNRIIYQATRVESLARRVEAESERVREAANSSDSVRGLFSRLAELSSPAGLTGTSATVYVPGPSGTYRVLAWSDGPAEDLTIERLGGPAALFVAPGASGLRLVALRPIETDGRRLGVAAAETLLSSRPARADLTHGACSGSLPTSYGPVVAAAPCAGAASFEATDHNFVVHDSAGEALLAISYDVEQLQARRAQYRRRLLVATLAPLLVLLLLLTGPAVGRRNHQQPSGAWAWSTAVISATVFLLGLAGVALCQLVGAEAVTPVVTGLTGLALAALVAGGLWWRPFRRRVPAGGAVRFGLEHGAGGALVAFALWWLSRLLQNRITAASVGVWQFPLFPFDPGALLYLIGVLLAQIAVCWTAASALGLLADRWRLGRRRVSTTAWALALWTIPTVALIAAERGQLSHAEPWIAVLAALGAFGLLSSQLRRIYRHTSQPVQLMLLFAALAAPPLFTYPLSATAADDAARTLIATDFAPAILDQPQVVLETLARARQQIDELPGLPGLIALTPQGDGSTAYAVWSRTSLADARLTSEVELFGPDRRLVSRFALNVPEYPYEEVPTWTGSSCSWDVFGEVARTGAQERVMLHAERGICDVAGQLRGAVVVHAVSDYRALPFIGSGSPYAQALRAPEDAAANAQLAGLEVVVYGWNDAALFTSSGTAWPVTSALTERLYASRDPFWTTLSSGSDTYAVYFVNDRRGFYALGYPYPSFMEHATRLAEITTVVAALLLVLLLGSTAYAPLVRVRPAPLPALFREIRTSFYRKLFLFFVLAAVGPVVLLALAFGAYTAARIRADVESEAVSAVTITRRLFEEFAAAELHPDQQQAPISDELMVVIRQMTQQDANLYSGSRLVASSQRDLFDSGLLPTRTPAAVYQAIALDRLPAFVGEDRIGTFAYLVAAAPIPARGRDAVISVPLGTRQREIEHEIDELARRMLTGTVIVLLFSAGLGASVAARVSDPVARLTRAARQIAAGNLDVRIVADTADELRRLVDDFNAMTTMLVRQRAELARSNQLKAWAQMARQVAHEIKNPLTPIQLAAEHLQRVHDDRGAPLGAVVGQCVGTILGQVRLLRQIASDFSNFAAEPTPRFELVEVDDLLSSLTAPYIAGSAARISMTVDKAPGVSRVRIDRTLILRALTNLVENAIQAMPQGGIVEVRAWPAGHVVAISVSDTGVGMDAEAAGRAFEPYFSTKTGGSGLGLPNAKRYVELSGGTIALDSTPGAGTTITLTLPAAPLDEAASDSASTP